MYVALMAGVGEYTGGEVGLTTKVTVEGGDRGWANLKVANKGGVFLANVKNDHWTEPFQLGPCRHRYAIVFYTHIDSISLPISDPVNIHLKSAGFTPWGHLA